MIGDVAVQEPRTRIVCSERYHHVASCGDQHHISTRWVLGDQHQVAWVVGVAALGQNGKVMSVQVNLCILVKEDSVRVSGLTGCAVSIEVTTR